MFAEQSALVPPYKPEQLHAQGPLPVTAVAAPALQSSLAGATVNVAPLEAPQTPLTGSAVKLAVMVIDAVTLLTVRGLAVVVMKPPVPVQLTKWYPEDGIAVTAVVTAPLLTVCVVVPDKVPLPSVVKLTV